MKISGFIGVRSLIGGSPTGASSPTTTSLPGSASEDRGLARRAPASGRGAATPAGSCGGGGRTATAAAASPSGWARSRADSGPRGRDSASRRRGRTTRRRPASASTARCACACPRSSTADPGPVIVTIGRIPALRICVIALSSATQLYCGSFGLFALNPEGARVAFARRRDLPPARVDPHHVHAHRLPGQHRGGGQMRVGEQQPLVLHADLEVRRVRGRRGGEQRRRRRQRAARAARLTSPPPPPTRELIPFQRSRHTAPARGSVDDERAVGRRDRDRLHGA